MATTNKDARFTGKVEIIGRTEFDRENVHAPLRRDGSFLIERFVCITMRTAQYGRIIVTYTRVDTAFAQLDLPIGSTFTLSAVIAEQRSDEFGPHFKATRCKVGEFKTISDCDAKAKRQAKMNAKLGLV